MSDLLDLLKEARKVLGDHWFSNDGEESYNNDDVIEMSDRLDAAISSLESAPQKKCGTCAHHGLPPEQWRDFPNRKDWANYCCIVGKSTIDNWFCADWQPRTVEEKT